MANEIVAISDLTEQTTASDSDCMVIGGADMKKIKWSTIVSLLKDKLLSNVGQTYSATGTVTTSTSASSYTTGATTTLVAGTYVLFAWAGFESASTTPRKTLQLYNASTGASIRAVSVAATLYTAMQVTDFVKLTSLSNISARVSANGTALSCNVAVKAIRIA